MKTLILTLVLVLACEEKEPEDTGSATDGGATDGGTVDGGSTDGGSTDECVEVVPDECNDTPGCRTLEAWPVKAEGDGWCVDFSEDRVALGCMSADKGCGDAETPATTEAYPDECQWLFPSTCLPPGYIPCPESALDECP